MTCKKKIREREKMLWVDKYRPNDLTKLDFHEDLGNRLLSMVPYFNLKLI
jgi:hypothetical protein